MPSPLRLAVAVAMATALSARAAEAAAQAHPSSVAPDEIRHIQSISPRSGPSGTLVSVSTLNLPYQARVHVGIGAVRDGFEALTEAEQGRWGEIAVRVQVPETTSWERAIVFVAFNANFAPIGMSDPFHVTDEDGRVSRSGTLVFEAGECPMLEDEDGYLYELTGTVDHLRSGDAADVVGVFFEAGPCTGGPTIGVETVNVR